MTFKIPMNKAQMSSEDELFEDVVIKGGKYEAPEPVIETIEPTTGSDEKDLLLAFEKSLAGPFSEENLSDEQRVIYNQVKSWADQAVGADVLTLGGYAGTGKSTVLSVIAGSFQDKNVAFCTYTGKAAGVLKKKFREADVWGYAYLGTIHRMMYKAGTDKAGRVSAWTRRDYLPFDLIVIDEASMVSEEVFEDLKTYDIPILAVGDHGQLPPVGGTFNLMEQPKLRLETIHRQAEGSPIIALASFIREHGRLPNPSEASVFESTGEVQFMQYRELDDEVERIYLNENTRLENIACLAYTNHFRVRLNETIRSIGIPNFMSGPQEGDQVICLKNQGPLVYNGMRGEVSEVRVVPDSGAHIDLTMEFRDEGISMRAHAIIKQFNRSKTFQDYNEISREAGFRPRSWATMGLLFDYGYCMTVHKSQGSSFEEVLLLNERPSFVTDDDYRRWLYTAVTRSSKNLRIFV